MSAAEHLVNQKKQEDVAEWKWTFPHNGSSFKQLLLSRCPTIALLKVFQMLPGVRHTFWVFLGYHLIFLELWDSSLGVLNAKIPFAQRKQLNKQAVT